MRPGREVADSPWRGNTQALALRIMSGEHAPLPDGAAPDLCRLVGMLLERDPAVRPSIEKVLRLDAVKVSDAPR